MREKVEKQLKRFLEDMDGEGGALLHELTIPEARQADDDFLYSIWEEVPEIRVKETEDRVAEEMGCSVPVRIYTPLKGNPPYPVIVFFHGGGWVVGSVANRDRGCRDIAAATGCCVVSVEYRLAPEHPFPAAADDCYAAALWVWNNAESLHVDRSHVIVMGDSAGGNLAAVTANLSAAAGVPVISGQVLVYPVTNLASIDTPSYLEFAEDHLLTRDTMEWLIRQYVPDPERRKDPKASPLFADLKAPPAEAYIFTAECDVLRDEGEEYGEKLQRGGVKTVLTRYPGMIHGFFEMATVSGAATKARKEIIQTIKKIGT